MIQNLTIRNYKTLRDVSVDLSPLTVFVGANGSGKTSVLEALHNTVRAVTGDPVKVFAHERHGDWLYTRGGDGPLSVRCETDQGAFGIEAVPPEGFPPPSDLLQKGRWSFHPIVEGASLDHAGRLMFLRLNASVMAQPSYSLDSPPRLKYTGEGLASVLSFLRDNDPDGFDALTEEARKLIPRLRRIRFRKETVYTTESELVRFGDDTVERRSRRPYPGEMILLDYDHAPDVSARAASEGTMLLLGLLTVLFGPSRPRTLLLDDLEHGLHPLAQTQLVKLIERLIDAHPGLQILATTHSPYLLNDLRPEQVRIMAVGPDGHSRYGRLTDHPEFEKWKEEMAPGELWSIFGEKWLINQETTA
jgi:predicted ATPase